MTSILSTAITGTSYVASKMIKTIFYGGLIVGVGTIAIAILTCPDDAYFRKRLDQEIQAETSKHVPNPLVAKVTSFGISKAAELITTTQFQNFVLCNVAIVRAQQKEAVFVGAFNNWFPISK